MSTDQPPRPTRSMHCEVEIPAGLEEVWRCLTEAQHLMRWFPFAARVKPGDGGEIHLSWGSSMEGTAPITLWSPPHEFAWTETIRRPQDPPDQPWEIVVHFQLEHRAGVTVVRLVQSGVGADESWDDYFGSTSRGWRFELNSLRHYLTHHFNQDRRVIWVQRNPSLDPELILPRLIGPDSSVLRADPGGLAPGAPISMELVDAPEALRRWQGRVVLPIGPDIFAATVDTQYGALLRIELEATAGHRQAWLWLSTWNWPDERYEALRAWLEQRVAAALP